jgi:hypothetical protein
MTNLLCTTYNLLVKVGFFAKKQINLQVSRCYGNKDLL